MIDREIAKYIFTPNTSARQVIHGLYQHKLYISLICDQGRSIIGIATLGDIKQAINNGLDPNEPIRNIMNKNFIWAKEGTSEETLKEMSKAPDGGSRRIPILNNSREVSGIFLNTNKSEFQYKTVLVTGGAGYVGSILCRKLINKGYKVIVLDKLYFSQEPIQDLINNDHFELIVGDISNINNLIQGIKEADYVIHLAGIVGDPASSVDPIYTMESNYFSTQALIELSKYFQVSRFIFASSCSVYGAGSQILTEDSDLNPVSLYARSKVASEKELLAAANNYFHPIILRFGTIYGLSPRMRFDLVVNIMNAHAFFNNKIMVNSGDQWRPLLHVADAAEACLAMIESPIEAVNGQVFNVGANDQNFKISDIAQTIQQHIPQTKIISKDTAKDKRDYRVNFNKIKQAIKFNPHYKLSAGIQEIITAMKQGKFQDFSNPIYSNYLHIKNNNK